MNMRIDWRKRFEQASSTATFGQDLSPDDPSNPPIILPPGGLPGDDPATTTGDNSGLPFNMAANIDIGLNPDGTPTAIAAPAASASPGTAPASAPNVPSAATGVAPFATSSAAMSARATANAILNPAAGTPFFQTPLGYGTIAAGALGALAFVGYMWKQ